MTGSMRLHSTSILLTCLLKKVYKRDRGGTRRYIIMPSNGSSCVALMVVFENTKGATIVPYRSKLLASQLMPPKNRLQSVPIVPIKGCEGHTLLLSDTSVVR